MVKQMMGVKFHITSYHVWAPSNAAGAQKGRFGRLKIKLSSKSQNLQGRMELI